MGFEWLFFGVRIRGEYAMGVVVVGEKLIVVIGEVGVGGGGGCVIVIEGFGVLMLFVFGGLVMKLFLSMDVSTSIFKYDVIVECFGGGCGGFINGDLIVFCSVCFVLIGVVLNLYIGVGLLFGVEFGALSNR